MKDEFDPGTGELLDARPPEGEAPVIRVVSVQSLYLDEHGREIPNPVPMQPPIGYVRHKTIAEQMREMIRQASAEASQMGAETEEEANDFDIEEDFDPTSPWEHDFEPDPALEMMIARQSRPPRKEGQEAKPPVPPSEGAVVKPEPVKGP